MKYKSASYFKPTSSGKCLAEHAKDKLIVVLNEVFLQEQGRGTAKTIDYI